MKQLPLQVKHYQKTVYVDGHERDDVVQDRMERFLPQMEQIMTNCVHTVEDPCGRIRITNENAEHILVSIDQKAQHSNDGPSW